MKTRSAFVVAAPHSGAGKTTVTLALLSALKARGLTVQSFKTGPDYIDPLHHAAITGLPGQNLDSWMLGAAVNRTIFNRSAAQAQVSVVEGVMGLFDGVDGQRPEGSTGHLANLLGLPVILVVDARSMARSAAALVSGFVNFDPALKVAGIIWNRVGSPSHRRILDEALEASGLPPALGAFGRDGGLTLGERHLGLVTPEDSHLDPAWRERLALAANEAVDLDRLLALTPFTPEAVPSSRKPKAPTKTIAIARDRAFAFYYEENFRVLERLGAKLVFFSPVEGDAVPPGADALYLGGGYPELHAERLAANEAFLTSVRALHEKKRPIYAECGGFMTLCESLADGEGRTHKLAGIFPAGTVMGKRLVRLGYREVTGLPGSPVASQKARGHEFHYSSVENMPDEIKRIYRMRNARGETLEPEGYVNGSALGGYVHLHFGSNPKFAARIFGL